MILDWDRLVLLQTMRLCVECQEGYCTVIFYKVYIFFNLYLCIANPHMYNLHRINAMIVPNHVYSSMMA